MQPIEIENLLIWWPERAVQFPHVSCLVRQVLGIVGSHIQIKWIFNVAGVITNLRRSRLSIENLDWLIFIIKNWPSDVCVGCDGPLKPKTMVEFLERDYAIIKEHNKLIEEQDFLKKIQILISFDFKFMFFFIPNLCLFLLT